ncbi:Transposase [Methylobacterium sp. 190mf]|nr:Transposase [Methylobacterium sp. 190mf]
MADRKQTFTPEFRAEAVRLAQTSGRSRREVAADLGVGLSTLRNWIDGRREREMDNPSTDRQGKIRIVLEGLRGEDSIAEPCRREGIASSMYYGWSKESLEAGKKRLAGDTARAATADEVQDLRREAGALKEVLADLVLENRLLKKTRTAKLTVW